MKIIFLSVLDAVKEESLLIISIIVAFIFYIIFMKNGTYTGYSYQRYLGILSISPFILIAILVFKSIKNTKISLTTNDLSTGHSAQNYIEAE